MAARASFSHDSRIVKMPLPNSVLLKDYLLDDLSSCSSNGFRSYPRRQCCTKVRYLIEMDLNKHVKLPPTQKRILKNKSKPKLKLKSKSALHKASAAVVNVLRKFNFSSSGSGSGNNNNNNRKANILPRNLSRKLWKKTTDQEKKEFKRLNSFDENILPPAAVTTTSNGNSNNSSASSESCFTATSNSSTTGGYSNINVGENNVTVSEQLATEKINSVAVTTVTAINSTGNAKKNFQVEEKNEFSPISVLEFSFDNDKDDEDEVTSPFQHNPFDAKGCKGKLISKVQRTKSLAQLSPIRLEDRIALSESGTQGLMLESSLQTQREFIAEKRAIALLQLLKATMSSHDLSESTMTEHVLLGFFYGAIYRRKCL